MPAVSMQRWTLMAQCLTFASCSPLNAAIQRGLELCDMGVRALEVTLDTVRLLTFLSQPTFLFIVVLRLCCHASQIYHVHVLECPG